MIPSPNIMLPTKSFLVCGTKSSPHTTVRFEVEEASEVGKELSSKPLTRKKTAEPFVAHEIRSWSSFASASNGVQVSTDIDKRSSDSYIPGTSRNQCLDQVIVHRSPSSNQERPNRCRSALIDRKKHSHHGQSELTWRSLFGTMTDVNNIITDKHFLRGIPCLQTLILFIDSCFRGMGQVMFANNPLSGLVSSKQKQTRLKKMIKSRKIHLSLGIFKEGKT
jgi:hypothetical protein